MKSLNENRNTYLIPLFATTALLWAMFWLYPMLNDDVWYTGHMSNFLANRSFSNFITDFRDQIVYRYCHDNARLSNIFGTVLVIGPKWFSSLFLALSYGASLYLAARLAGVWRRNLAGYAIIIFIYAIAMPWNDHMYTVMCGVSYVTATVFIGATLLLIYKKPDVNYIGAFFLGLVSCWWHEMVGVAILGGLAALLICFPKYRTRSVWATVAGIILATVYLVTCPGVVERSSMFRLNIGLNLRYGIITCMPFYITALSAIILLSIRSTRREFFDPRFAIAVGGTLGGFLLMRVFMAELRICWAMLYMSSIAIAFIISKFCRRSFWAWCGMALTALIIAQQAATIPWFVEMRKVYDQGMALQRNFKEGDPYVLIEFEDDFTVPFYTLNRPNMPNIFCNGLDKDLFRPARLQDFNPSAAQKLPRGMDAYLYKGMAVSTYMPEASEVCIRVYYHGSSEDLKVDMQPMENEHGRFCYIKPRNGFMRSHLFGIEGFDIVEEYQ